MTVSYFFRILFGMQNVCTLKNDNNHFMVNKLRFTFRRSLPLSGIIEISQISSVN